MSRSAARIEGGPTPTPRRPSRRIIALIPYAILFPMPANLTPQYLEAEKRFKAAVGAPEKLVALQEMMAIIPKHKGTEKLRAELKRKMSAMRKESTQKRSASRKDFFLVEREGARQLALVGAPNSGKSSLMSRLTNRDPEVADYPFTTRAPAPGMMVYQDVSLQLIDLPPVSEVHMEYWVPQIIRNADAVLWIVDLSDDSVLDQMESTIAILGEAGSDLRKHQTLLVGNKNDSGGSPDREQIVREIYGGSFPFVAFSSNDPDPVKVEGFEERGLSLPRSRACLHQNARYQSRAHGSLRPVTWKHGGRSGWNNTPGPRRESQVCQGMGRWKDRRPHGSQGLCSGRR